MLELDLKNLEYKTSEYTTFKIYEPKEREIFRLPYYPDRIAHHAIMNVMEPIWTKIFIDQTYSSIKNRGIHKAHKALLKDLKKYPENTIYCLKLDIRKFYPSIDHNILIEILEYKIKDKKLMGILKEIIHSAPGVPIGNYLSQFFANLYLTYFDHWVKEELKCKFYYRYADDIVILSSDKNWLRNRLLAIKIYLKHRLKLNLKPNYQIFPVESRGIDFVGYKFYHTHVLLRKSIKLRLLKLVNKYKNNKIDKIKFKKSLQSYFGWIKYCNSKHLLTKLEQEFGIKLSNWDGYEIKLSKIKNKYIKIIELVKYDGHFRIHFLYKNKSYFIKSQNKYLYQMLCYTKFPFIFKFS